MANCQLSWLSLSLSLPPSLPLSLPQPVVCSELEELREASKMTVFPPVISASLSPPATSRDTRSQTFTITPPTTSSSNSPTRQSSSSSSHHSEKSNGSRDSSQSGSVSSVASSAASREGTNQHQKNKRKIEKKSTRSVTFPTMCILNTALHSFGGDRM